MPTPRGTLPLPGDRELWGSVGEIQYSRSAQQFSGAGREGLLHEQPSIPRFRVPQVV